MSRESGGVNGGDGNGGGGWMDELGTRDKSRKETSD